MDSSLYKALLAECHAHHGAPVEGIEKFVKKALSAKQPLHDIIGGWRHEFEVATPAMFVSHPAVAHLWAWMSEHGLFNVIPEARELVHLVNLLIEGKTRRPSDGRRVRTTALLVELGVPEEIAAAARQAVLSPPVKTILSAHPLDLLLASNGFLVSLQTGSQSCHSPGGGYECGNLHYAQDNATMVAFVPGERIGRMSGRMLIYVGRDRKLILFGRIYGRTKSADSNIMNGESRKAVGNFLTNKIGGAGSVWTYVSGRSENFNEPRFIHHDGEVYLDKTYFTGLSYLAGNDGCIDFGAYRVPCLSCGEDKRYAGERFCSSCSGEHEDEDGYPCHSCEERYASGDMVTVGRYQYCSGCYDSEFYSCASCEEPVRQGYGYSHGEDSYCESCWRERFFTCGHCSESAEQGDSVEVVTYSSAGFDFVRLSREDWCRCCAEDEAVWCGNCEEQYSDERFDRRCAGCDNCGERFSLIDLTQRSSATRSWFLCSDCVPEHDHDAVIDGCTTEVANA